MARIFLAILRLFLFVRCFVIVGRVGRCQTSHKSRKFTGGMQAICATDDFFLFLLRQRGKIRHSRWILCHGNGQRKWHIGSLSAFLLFHVDHLNTSMSTRKKTLTKIHFQKLEKLCVHLLRFFKAGVHSLKNGSAKSRFFQSGHGGNGCSFWRAHLIF